MSATVQHITDSVETTAHALGRASREAAEVLACLGPKAKEAALLAAAMTMRADAGDILDANARDLEEASQRGLAEAKQERLTLNDERVEAMATALEDIAALPDPVGQTVSEWSRPNGLNIRRVRTPLGVVGVIYESRPNVTADAGALCLKAGNAVILRGGSECYHSNRAIHECLKQGLIAADIPEGAIQLVPSQDRAFVSALLSGLGGAIDVIVPRGGVSLLGRVKAEARVPVFGHLEGVCTIFVDREADLAMARDVVVNAKLRRTSICGAAETLLVDEQCAATHLKPLVTDLLDAGCAVRGDQATQAVDPRVEPATQEDWPREYLDAIISVGVVADVQAAMAHIGRYGSQHTEAIITDNEKTAALFLDQVDSAIVMHNTSTQYADGGEFGMGAEIGIATGRLHARGPVGVEQLTSFKYQVRGSGQTRP
ncbi:MAG: glutamate-5-semialdehyde dehydrogenase [Parvularculales bacterium]